MNQQQLNFQRGSMGALFRSRMKHLQLSIEHTAEKAEMQPNTLERIFEGKMWPNMKQVLLICDALKMGVVFTSLTAQEELGISPKQGDN